MLQARFVYQQILMRVLGLVQLPVEQIHRFLDLTNFLYNPVMRWVATKLHIGPVSTRFQTRLSDLKRRLLISDSFFEMLNMFLLKLKEYSLLLKFIWFQFYLIIDFLHGLGHVRLQFVVSLSRLSNSLLQ